MTTQPPERGDADEEGGPRRPAGLESPSGPPQPPTGSEAAGGSGPPGGPQSPAAGPQSPASAPGAAPETPAPTEPPGYSGPVPPGGWQQPLARTTALPAGVQLASWDSRVGASLLDSLVLLVLLLVLVAPGVALGIATNRGGLGAGIGVLGLFVWMVLALLYAPVLMRRAGHRNGQSLGKQWVGIRVHRVSGQPTDFGYSLLREFVIKYLLFGVVGGFFLSIPTLLDALWPLWDDENRALHDMLANSRVIRA
jgi:uncharacterized RDD family membrane protein YckC